MIHSALSGLRANLGNFERSASRLAREGIEGDLAGNLVQLQVDKHAVSASVAAVRTADEMIGSLLDVLV
jgi:hypothetical protein